MTKHEMEEAYLRYMEHLVCESGYGGPRSWRKLFRLLHETEFVYQMDMDANRADDGTDLRYRFAYEMGLPTEEARKLDGRPCSMMEMMTALAVRCEEQIMACPEEGDRTGKWFFVMIDSMGLGDMDDGRFREEAARRVLQRCLQRAYDPSGQGGLFTLRSGSRDMREAEIWYQMMWYLGEEEI